MARTPGGRRDKVSYGRNPRLVLNEDDLKWEANEENMSLLLRQFLEDFRSKPLNIRKISFQGCKMVL